jgi:flagellar biogenesis protein FliO
VSLHILFLLKQDMVILFISRYVTFVNVSMYIAVYMFVYFIFIENTMVHTKVTPRKTKEVQLIASCMLCSRDFSNV